MCAPVTSSHLKRILIHKMRGSIEAANSLPIATLVALTSNPVPRNPSTNDCTADCAASFLRTFTGNSRSPDALCDPSDFTQPMRHTPAQIQSQRVFWLAVSSGGQNLRRKVTSFVELRR
jgi:hypothetical protein